MHDYGRTCKDEQREIVAIGRFFLESASKLAGPASPQLRAGWTARIHTQNVNFPSHLLGMLPGIPSQVCWYLMTGRTPSRLIEQQSVLQGK